MKWRLLVGSEKSEWRLHQGGIYFININLKKPFNKYYLFFRAKKWS